MIRRLMFLFLALCLTLGPLAGPGEAAHAVAANHVLAHGDGTGDGHCDTPAAAQSAPQSCAACPCAAALVGAAVSVQIPGISRVVALAAASHDQVPMGLMAAPLPRPPRT